MKSAVVHAIKTNRFPEATRILSICWKRCRAGLFSFTSTHDLCDASFSRKGLEQMVHCWYQWELERLIEDGKEFERRHPEMASIHTPGDGSKT